MKRKLPPFKAVRAFEAAARHLSFKAAAAELNVTQSAISHQVKCLEEYLGVLLFVRQPAGVELTAPARLYLHDLTSLLDNLDTCTQTICREEASGPLAIQATPAFAARWLVPRMDRFNRRFPDIELQVSTALPPTDFSRGDLDVVIHWGDEPVPGVVIEPFLTSRRFPVCSPALLDYGPELDCPGALRQFTLLRDVVADGWEAWFESAGGETTGPRGGPRFEHCELVLTAAEQGQGVALAYGALIENELADGKLVRIFEAETSRRLIYSIAYLESRRNVPKIAHFRDWIFDEIAAAGRTNSDLKPPVAVAARTEPRVGRLHRPTMHRHTIAK